MPHLCDLQSLPPTEDSAKRPSILSCAICAHQAPLSCRETHVFSSTEKWQAELPHACDTAHPSQIHGTDINSYIPRRPQEMPCSPRHTGPPVLHNWVAPPKVGYLNDTSTNGTSRQNPGPYRRRRSMAIGSKVNRVHCR